MRKQAAAAAAPAAAMPERPAIADTLAWVVRRGVALAGGVQGWVLVPASALASMVAAGDAADPREHDGLSLPYLEGNEFYRPLPRRLSG
ncbi:hypothetical protein [Variovorax rhizosphaerae]|uniref:Uncharacterized protein n=1 Tax=Variovorax rhizosphaerae TaxID=1836200 RepID=A0ABU8WJK5_9BURK